MRSNRSLRRKLPGRVWGVYTTGKFNSLWVGVDSPRLAGPKYLSDSSLASSIYITPLRSTIPGFSLNNIPSSSSRGLLIPKPVEDAE